MSLSGFAPGLFHVKGLEAAGTLRRILARQLELTPRKEVFFYVHGYRNSFEDAAFAMAELWHFMGRIGVPIIYSWPAGYPGLFGYTYDRESSKFTVYTSPNDRAIDAASRLFASPRGRMGTFGIQDMTNALRAALEFSRNNLSIIKYQGTKDRQGSHGDQYGHSYFRNAPSVSSDLVLMLRDDLDPGTPGRPLEPLGFKFWRIPEGYPGKSPVP